MAEVLRAIVVGMGIIVLCMDFVSFAHRRMTESLGLVWGFFAVLLILFGAVPGLSDWSKVLPKEACAAFLVMGGIAILGLFYLSGNVSKLLRKNQELAMQVSLLNQENERILGELEMLTGKSKTRI